MSSNYASPAQAPAQSAVVRPVMILAGGTGGHIFPGLAVAKVLRARGVPVTWLGADGAMETRLVPQHDIQLDTLAITGLRGKGLMKLLGAPVRVMRAVRAAGFVLRKRQPRAVISFGGFAAGPGGLAARLLGVPLLVHEQNRAPGMTNKVLSRVARRVLTGFPGSFAGEEAVGNPVRAEIAALPVPALRLVGRGGPVRMLVLGGSQGARALNQAVPAALAALGHPDVDVRHQCGEKLRAEAEASYAQAGVNASVEPFIADMAAAYAWADPCGCRAGA
ncbi:undecaprenyldiphospho-muramoylpentapeptide beta-N-acetylglucosaminyltransferase, partial [Xanthomonas hortorum]|uniref:undecaprenyldiphospho-muramoylpentapeptide beta-N-acetylglucosaminyltransferase n=1 Tax=Xanthomonas hortorum TaxID=56454 RepID=UPI002FE0ABBA